MLIKVGAAYKHTLDYQLSVVLWREGGGGARRGRGGRARWLPLESVRTLDRICTMLSIQSQLSKKKQPHAM